jgi:hypothetical protein
MQEPIRVECLEHGWQQTVVYTRFERRGHPRDIPDRHVCQECARAGLLPNQGNSLRIGPPDALTRLRSSMNDLAGHFRRWHEPNLAAAVEGALDGETDQLPRRALALFTHGMGGLLDRPLCKTDGRVDQQATNRRDRLAQEVHTTARTFRMRRQRSASCVSTSKRVLRTSCPPGQSSPLRPRPDRLWKRTRTPTLGCQRSRLLVGDRIVLGVTRSNSLPATPRGLAFGGAAFVLQDGQVVNTGPSDKLTKEAEALDESQLLRALGADA